jgi:hypothetical protein
MGRHKISHQGQLKYQNDGHRGGVDCIGLIVGIVRDLNLKSHVLDNRQFIPLCQFDKLA